MIPGHCDSNVPQHCDEQYPKVLPQQYPGVQCAENSVKSGCT